MNIFKLLFLVALSVAVPIGCFVLIERQCGLGVAGVIRSTGITMLTTMIPTALVAYAIGDHRGYNKAVRRFVSRGR